jgi:hypothetical protein
MPIAKLMLLYFLITAVSSIALNRTLAGPPRPDAAGGSYTPAVAGSQ